MVKKRKGILFCHVIFEKGNYFVPRLNIAVIFRVTYFVIYGTVLKKLSGIIVEKTRTRPVRKCEENACIHSGHTYSLDK